MNRVFLLRAVHGTFALYFILCLIYIYYSAIFLKLDAWLLVAIVSLAFEGFVVFVLNGGDCPLIHIQKKIGDDTPFFNLFLPAKIAKQVIPVLVKVTWIGLILLGISVLMMYAGRGI